METCLQSLIRLSMAVRRVLQKIIALKKSLKRGGKPIPDFLQSVLRLPGGVPQLQPPPLVLLLPEVLLRQERPQLLQGAPPTGAALAAARLGGAGAGVCAAGAAGLLRSLILGLGTKKI